MGKRGKADFTASTIRVLREEVANRCSKPDCRVICIAKGDEIKGNINIIGQAAHICAASPGGPRYDSDMGDEDRSHINNGIWLCSNHATEIDKNASKYPVELLHEWKIKAIEKAQQEIGKPLPTEHDAINLLTTALSGSPRDLGTKALSNVAVAVSESLQVLDPRFTIDTSFTSGETIHRLSTNTDVKLKLLVDTEYSDKIREHYESGKKVEIPTHSINIEGSPLFEDILSQEMDGVFSIGAREVDAVFKCVLTKDKDFFALDDIHGKISIGKKRAVFYGTSFDGLLCIEIPIDFDKPKTGLNITIECSLWSGRKVKSIKHTSAIKRFLELVLNDDWSFRTSLKVDHKDILSGSVLNRGENSGFEDLLYFSDYYDSAFKIARFFDLDAVIPDEFELKDSDFNNLKYIVQVIESGDWEISVDSFNNPPKITFILCEEVRRVFGPHLNSRQPQTFSITEKKQQVNLFGTLESIGDRYYKFIKCFLTSNSEIDRLPNGSTFDVAVSFDASSACYITYTPPTEESMKK